MGTCYSVQGKGEVRPYFTVKPLSKGSPVLRGDHSDSCSPVKTDLEPPPKSVLKNSPNWSQSSSPLFEKKVQRQVSFDLMSDLVLPFSEAPSSSSTPSRPAPAPGSKITVGVICDRETEKAKVRSSGAKKPPEGELPPGLLLKSSGVMNLSQDELCPPNAGVDLVRGTANGEMSDTTPDLLRNTVAHSESPPIPPSSQLQTIEVNIELVKEEGKTLGFSIAGGRGSTPAYEDVDESIFVTKIAPGGLSEADGRLRLGDKLLMVNEVDMVNATHAEAVAALKSVTDSCTLVVSREVLVVMPEDLQETERNVELPTDLPSPAAKLMFGAEGEEEQAQDQNGETFAKKIVSEILDRSVDRLIAEGGEGAEGETEEPVPSEQDKPPHDNYVNFDIAKTVLEANTRKERGDSLPPMSAVNGFDHDRAPQRHSTAFSDLDDDEEEDYPRERVLLDRSIGKLGLSIAGGADHISHVFGLGRPGIYISKITRGGAAEATGKLRLGDRILEVNNHNVRFANHQQAVQLLISQLGNIELLVQHVPQPPGLEMVLLEKEPDAKLGISIRGGGKGSKGNPLDRNDEGIFISKIAVGGAAAKDGRLKVGHRILEVNGISLLGASHLDAVKALRSSPDRISVTVCQGFSPQDVLRRKSEGEALASARAGKIPLSAASSLALDDALNRLLSESMDSLNLPTKSQSAIAPAAYAVGSPRYISRSTMDITDGDAPVTADELDELLKGLTTFGDIDYSKLETSGKKGSKTPVQQPIPLSEILSPLQQGFFSKEPSEVTLVEDDTVTPVGEREEGETEGDAERKASEKELKEELESVDVGDTSSLLETLDTSVTMMQDEVFQRESEIAKEKEVKDEEDTPKVRRKGTRTHLKVDSVPNKMPSPATRRRADALKLSVEPPNMKASEAAVKSIIGEVFSDISFEEFERSSSTPVSGLSSGVMTPSTDFLRSQSPDKPLPEMNDLLSALRNISTSEEPVQEQAEQATSNGGETFAAPPVVEKKEEEEFEKVEPRGRANTLPSVESEETEDGVILRVPSGIRHNPDKRKSAPPKVPEKPTSKISPEKLSFQEKLALHKKVADAEPVVPSVPIRPKSGSDAQRQRPYSTMVITEEPEPQMKRTLSEGELETEPVVEDTTPVPLGERIASLQASQTKAGMKPVEVHPGLQSTTRRMSSEEKRLVRVSANLDDETTSTTVLHANEDSSTTYVLESGQSDPYISPSEDSSMDPKPLLQGGVTVSDNSNNNNNDIGIFVTTTSLYVSAVEPELNVSEEHTNSVSMDTNKSNSEPTVCHSQDPTF